MFSDATAFSFPLLKLHHEENFVLVVFTPISADSRFRCSIVHPFIVHIWYATSLPPSAVRQSFMLKASKPRLPGGWMHRPPDSLTALATTSTTTGFMTDTGLPLDIRYRSMLVASDHCCQHPSTTTTCISNVCQVPSTTTHSLIVIPNYQ
jgi:hypothetical protein